MVARIQRFAKSVDRNVASRVTVGIVGIVSRMLTGAEKLGEQPDEEKTETRHAGADNTNIDFDC